MSDLPSPPAPAARQVILALEEAGAPDFLFALAAFLARGQGSGLVAKVRENLDLHTAATLPFVQQVDRHSAATREWTPTQARQARLRTERQWQQRLKELSLAHTLRAQLEWVRGSRLDFLRGGLASQDVLVLGSGRDGDHEGALRIAAVCLSHTVDTEVIAAAKTLGESMRAGIQFLQAGQQEPGLSGPPHAARALPVGNSLGAIISAAAAARARILVLPRRLCGPDAAGVVQAFLARPGRCIVVIP